MTKAARRCKECPPGSTRPAPHPGPRCHTHHKARKKALYEATHEARMQKVFGMAPGMYQRLYEGQNGRCWICQWATGRTKRLAADHDHACTAGHPPEMACPLCLRGLLCGPCNQMIGRLGTEGLLRAYYYLVDPPARRILSLQ